MSKRLNIIVLLIAIIGTASAHTYTTQSVLSSGSFVKIRVDKAGLYSISYSDLASMGLDANNIRVYGFGGAMLSQNFTQSRTDDLPTVPVFFDDINQRIIFYAQANISWRYTGSRFAHTRNPYSDYGYYFLTSDHGSPVSFPNATISNGSSSQIITTYSAIALHELDSLNLVDRNGVDGGGREFYGEIFTVGAKRLFTFPELNNSVGDVYIYADVAAASAVVSTFKLEYNGSSTEKMLAAIPVSDYYTMATSTTINNTTEHGGDEVALSFSSSKSSALGFLNYIEVTTECPLTLSASTPLFFRTKQGFGTNNILSFRIAGASASTEVWDITDPAKVQKVPTQFENDTLSFMATNRTIRQYVAFNPATVTTGSPVTIGQVKQQNLHALSNIDYVVITPETLRYEAQRLADAHAEIDGFTTAVVTDEEVYNEFSSGTPDATAYRWLMKMLYDRAIQSGGSVQKPQYLLLFGDGTFDNRKLLKTSGNNTLLTYQARNSLNEVKAYATDDYFGFLDDTEGEVDIYGRMDIGIGRVPVNTVAQAAGVVDKLLRHMQNSSKGIWKNRMVFVADDGDHNLHTKGSDYAGEALRLLTPDFITHKIYLDAYTQEVTASGEQYPLAQQKMDNLLKDGVLLFDYCGHSGYNNASSEGLISTATIKQMQNDNLGFWLFVSCSFSLFDAGKVSAGEEAVLNTQGGALAICAASRTVYANQNEILNRHICDSLFYHSSAYNYSRRLGDAVRLGKNACGSDENKMSYLLLGDPASSLHFPTQYQVVTTQLSDTINALSVNEIKGYISDENGDTAKWFNGKLHITVFDKMQQVTTLDNDETDESKKQKYTYNDYPNILFQGVADIENGLFSNTFMTPKDIRYNYGNGRIVYYAYDTTTGEEGVGHYEDFIIGGSSTVQIIDTLGPEMQVYLNTPSFNSGDDTNEAPHFFAKIADENGINTVGSGIGHDLLLVIDGKPSETYILNDYFTAANNSYQAGTISYRMAELSEGQHSLFFRAWDLVNNSASRTITFNVVKGLNPSIMSVIAFPNPIPEGGTVNIVVDYDRPDEIMQTDLFIYDLSGRQVEHLSQRGTEALTWDMSATGGVAAGIYLYQVQLSSENIKTVSKTGKIIITK